MEQRSGEQVSPLLLTTSFSDALDNDDNGDNAGEYDESYDSPEEAEQHVPTISSYLGHLSLWCQRLRKPILVILLNVVLMALGLITISHTIKNFTGASSQDDWGDLDLFDLDLEDDGLVPLPPPPPSVFGKPQDKTIKLHTLKTMVSVGISILSLAVLLDAYVCLQGARELEKRAMAQNSINGREELKLDIVVDPEAAAEKEATGTGVSSSEQHQEETATNNPPVSSPTTTRVNSTGKDNDDFDILSVSRSVDDLFGCNNSSPGSTFVIGLLYALFALSVWLLFLSCSTVAYIQLVKEVRVNDLIQCWREPFLRYPEHDWRDFDDSTREKSLKWLAQQPAAQGIPQEVQTWLKSDCQVYPHNYGVPRNENNNKNNHNNKGSSSSKPHLASHHNSRHGYYKGSLPYVRSVDGSIAFPFGKRQSQEDRSNVDRGVILDLSANGTTTTLELSMDQSFFAGHYYEEGPVQLVGIPNRPPYQGWCGVSGNAEPRILRQQVICYNGAAATTNGSSSNTREQIIEFPGQKAPKQKDSHGTSWSTNYPVAYATDQTLWLAGKHQWSVRHGHGHHDHGDESNNKRDFYHLHLTSYNIVTKEMKVILETQRNETHVNENMYFKPVYPLLLHSTCNHYSHRILLWASIPVLLLLSIYLYRQDIPSSLVPASVALVLGTMSTLSSLWPLIVDLSIAMIITLLLACKKAGPLAVQTLWKFLSQEMLLWAQYSLLACHFLELGLELWHTGKRDFREGGTNYLRLYILVPTVTCMVAAVNAVVLQHPVFELFGIGFGILCLCSIPMIVLARGPIYLLPLPIVGCALSCGCKGVGHVVKECRLHVMVYCRRCCWYLQTKMMKTRRGGR